jgi:hypothetical protein
LAVLDESNSYVEDVLAMMIASFYCFLLEVSILESARYLPGTYICPGMFNSSVKGIPGSRGERFSEPLS